MAETENWTPGPWREALETRAVEICTIHCCSPRSTTEPEAQRWLYIVSANSVCRSEAEQDANARLIAQSPRFADIAARAQYLANERGGDYSDLTKDELCAFMVEFDEALSDARGEP